MRINQLTFPRAQAILAAGDKGNRRKLNIVKVAGGDDSGCGGGEGLGGGARWIVTRLRRLPQLDRVRHEWIMC